MSLPNFAARPDTRAVHMESATGATTGRSHDACPQARIA